MEIKQKNYTTDFLMKAQQSIFTIALSSLFLFASCDKHDNLDDQLIVGEMAPQVHWELASNTVKAGSKVSFVAQYYSTGEAPISHSEVWYDLEETIEKEVSCPWTVSFKYLITSTTSERKRIAEKVASFEHQEALWNPELRAYKLEGSFPTSPTLSSVSWKEPEVFGTKDSLLMKKYFGENFMQHFKDSLFSLMQAADFQKMYQGLDLVSDFKKQFLDSTLNKNSGSWDYHFPIVNGEKPVPQAVVEIYQKIPFADLLIDQSSKYAVKYQRQYSINAFIKVIDTDKNEGKTFISKLTEITLN